MIIRVDTLERHRASSSEVRPTYPVHESGSDGDYWAAGQDDQRQQPAVVEADDNAGDSLAGELYEIAHLVSDTVLYLIDVAVTSR